MPQPLPFLDFLIDHPVRGAVVSGGGVLVSVPSPARFALHKLILAGERTVATHAKREKDLRQAGQMLALLLEERPGDVRIAWDNIRARGRGWVERVKAGASSLKRLEPPRREETPDVPGRNRVDANIPEEELAADGFQFLADVVVSLLFSDAVRMKRKVTQR